MKGVVGGAASSASKIVGSLDHAVRSAGSLDAKPSEDAGVPELTKASRTEAARMLSSLRWYSRVCVCVFFSSLPASGVRCERGDCCGTARPLTSSFVLNVLAYGGVGIARRLKQGAVFGVHLFVFIFCFCFCQNKNHGGDFNRPRSYRSPRVFIRIWGEQSAVPPSLTPSSSHLGWVAYNSIVSRRGRHEEMYRTHREGYC